MALNSLKALSPAVECLPWVLDGVFKCIITTSTNVFSLHIGSEPESANVGCMSEWSINGSFWWAHNLCTDLLEVNCVMLNVSTERVLSIILSTESVSDNNFFLWVVLKLELNRRNINKKTAHDYRDYNCIFWLTFSQSLTPLMSGVETSKSSLALCSPFWGLVSRLRATEDG